MKLSLFLANVSLTRVRRFAGCEAEDERDASGIAETMDFTDEPAPRTAKSLFASPPFCAGNRDLTGAAASYTAAGDHGVYSFHILAPLFLAVLAVAS
jgi:hypothetical protein